MTNVLDPNKSTSLKVQASVDVPRGEKWTSNRCRSTSSTRAPSSSLDTSSGSESSQQEILIQPLSMGREGREKEYDSSELIEKVSPFSSGSDKKSPSGVFVPTNSDGVLRNPDLKPQEGFGNATTTTSAGLVVPSVIRVSPSTSGKAASPVVPVVRPCPVKTPPQQSANDQTAGAVGPAPSETVQDTVAARNVVDSKETAEAPGSSIQPLPPPPQAKGSGKQEAAAAAVRRQEAQVNFPPLRNNTRMPTAATNRAAMAQMDGVQPPHARQQHHGHRQQRTAAMRPTSITSSTGGTPTVTRRHPRGMSASSNPGDTESEASPTMPPTPLFQRLVTEEVQELKSYTRIIEEQNRRLNEVEEITADLEGKLQQQTRARMDLERSLESRERFWSDKFEKLEADRDESNGKLEQEKKLNVMLNDQVIRMEQEIRRMLQRKYDNQRDNFSGSMSRNTVRMHSERSGHHSPLLIPGNTGTKPSSASPGRGERKKEHFTSPREIFDNDGSVEVVRKRNIESSLLDFFGMF